MAEVLIEYGGRGFVRRAKVLLQSFETFVIRVTGVRGRLLRAALPEIRSFYESVHGEEGRDTVQSVWGTVRGSIILVGALLPLTQLLFRAIAARRRMVFIEEPTEVRITVIGKRE